MKTKEKIVEILEKHVANSNIEMIHINVEQIASEIEALPETTMEQTSDEDIEKFVESCPGNTGNTILDKGIGIGFTLGAKAFRDGKIKR